MSVNPTFRSASLAVVARIADDEHIAASLLGPLSFDREGMQQAERARERPGSAMLQTIAQETRAVTAQLASAGVTQAEVGPHVWLSQGHRALAHWTECGGPDVIGVVMSTGTALGVDVGYDPIRLQRAEDFAPIVAVLERVEREWNDLLGARGKPALKALEDQALAALYIGQLQALYRDAIHRGHAVLAACS